MREALAVQAQSEAVGEEAAKPQEAVSMAEFTCDVCGETVPSERGLQVHKGRLHPVGRVATAPSTSDGDRRVRIAVRPGSITKPAGLSRSVQRRIEHQRTETLERAALDRSEAAPVGVASIVEAIKAIATERDILRRENAELHERLQKMRQAFSALDETSGPWTKR